MKKLFLLAVLFSAITTAQAQYKKASFLNKEGRTYEFGTSLNFLNKVKSNALDLHIGFGREANSRRGFHWYDFRFMPKYNFQINSVGQLNNSGISVPVVVSGKSNALFSINYNYGRFLIDNSNENNKVLPFAKFNIGWGASYGIIDYKTSPNASSINDDFAEYNSALTVGAGFGLTYKVSKTIGIKALGTYNFVYSLENKDNDVFDLFYYVTYPAHPSVSLSVRWLFEKDAD
jgi:hypothetical protein